MTFLWFWKPGKERQVVIRAVETIHRFPGRPPSLFLRAAHAHSAVPGGQNALEYSDEMHCLKMHFAHHAKRSSGSALPSGTGINNISIKLKQ
jgi:hypothetical protein